MEGGCGWVLAHPYERSVRTEKPDPTPTPLELQFLAMLSTWGFFHTKVPLAGSRDAIRAYARECEGTEGVTFREGRCLGRDFGASVSFGG